MSAPSNDELVALLVEAIGGHLKTSTADYSADKTHDPRNETALRNVLITPGGVLNSILPDELRPAAEHFEQLDDGQKQRYIDLAFKRLRSR
jgi:hypothetical protein